MTGIALLRELIFRLHLLLFFILTYDVTELKEPKSFRQRKFRDLRNRCGVRSRIYRGLCLIVCGSSVVRPSAPNS